VRLVSFAGFQACDRFLRPTPLARNPKVLTSAIVVVPRKPTSPHTIWAVMPDLRQEESLPPEEFGFASNEGNHHLWSWIW
jgi:hypothetical protein